MTLVRRTLPFALVVAALAGAAPVVAQDTTQVRPDTVAPSAPIRTPPADTTAPVARPAEVPIVEPEVPRGPLPRGSRYTFTRDSIAWSSALTLAELLGAIPGVYVARGGWVGQSDYVVYGGRGARTLQVFWDGLELPAVGGDSVYFDPARVYLVHLRRVDVEVLPAGLRIFLVSERHETLDVRSVVRVMSGDYAAAQYAGLFQKRWAGGLGINLAANFVGSNGFSGANRRDHAFDVWARIDWLPNERAGLVYQIRRQNQDRDAVVLPDTAAPARHGTRTDAQLKAFVSTRPRGQGLGAELILGSAGWGRDSLIGEQAVHQAVGTFRLIERRANVEVSGRLADRRMVQSLMGRGGVSPLPWLSLAVDGGLHRFSYGRNGYDAHATASVFYGPFSVAGEVALAKLPQASAIRMDTAVRTLDQQVRAGFDTRWLSGHVGLVRRDAYAPRGFPNLPVVAALAPSPRSTYLVTGFKLQPLRPLTLDGWYATPREGRLDFQPPTHGRVQLTLRSKFWRTFRSGAFDLKLQLAMESWSGGTAGRTSSGTPVGLNGISFYEAFVSFQIVGFTAFWDLRNAYNAREEYIPRMPYPRNAQTFGVRWEFFN